MKNIILIISLAILAIGGAACGGAKTDTTTGTKANNSATDNKSTTSSTTTTAAAGSPSATIKQIYELAIKRDGKAILPLLTEDLRKEVGTSNDAMDALCDSFTDSGKLTKVDVKEEKVSGETATVKVTLTNKDGKTSDKEEKAKKVDGKWLMENS